MERPISIVWFERCYLASVAVGLVNTALSWNVSTTRLAESPGAAQLGASFGSSILLFGTAVSIAISLTLWFFTARKRAVVGKLIITAFFALALLGMIVALANGTLPAGISAVLGIIAVVLDGIAVWQLFRPDARAWFGETTV